MEIGGGTIDGRPVDAKNDDGSCGLFSRILHAQELNEMANKGGKQVYRGNGC